MGVCRKRSTTSVPAALSISYLIGSPPIGTSTMTFTSSGGLMPMAMASMRMGLTSGLSIVEQVGVRARAGKPHLRVGSLVDQQPIGLDVALAPALPFPLQRMITPRHRHLFSAAH